MPNSKKMRRAGKMRRKTRQRGGDNAGASMAMPPELAKMMGMSGGDPDASMPMPPELAKMMGMSGGDALSNAASALNIAASAAQRSDYMTANAGIKSKKVFADDLFSISGAKTDASSARKNALAAADTASAAKKEASAAVDSLAAVKAELAAAKSAGTGTTVCPSVSGITPPKGGNVYTFSIKGGVEFNPAKGPVKITNGPPELGEIMWMPGGTSENQPVFIMISNGTVKDSQPTWKAGKKILDVRMSISCDLSLPVPQQLQRLTDPNLPKYVSMMSMSAPNGKPWSKENPQPPWVLKLAPSGTTLDGITALPGATGDVSKAMTGGAFQINMPGFIINVPGTTVTFTVVTAD